MDISQHPCKAQLYDIINDFIQWAEWFNKSSHSFGSIDVGSYDSLFKNFAQFCAVYNVEPIDQIEDPRIGFSKAEDRHTRIKYMFESLLVLESEIDTVNSIEKLEQAIGNEAIELGIGKIYEFTDDEFDRAQNLINDLRDHFTKAKNIDDEHRRRILNQLGKLQSELHKKLSDFDHWMGRLVGLGEALGQFGEKSKPFFDRYREIIQDARNVIKRHNGNNLLLSTDEVSQLPKPQEENPDEDAA